MPIEMDRWDVDFMVTGSQKTLALPPGLAFGAVSERLLERARTIDDAGYYFSVTRWVSMATNYELFETPALSIYFALITQLRRIAQAGGWPERWARHQALAARFHQWIDQHPKLELLAPAGRRSPTVSAVRIPAGLNPGTIAAGLEQQGYLVGQAIDAKHGPLLRIGHMGDLSVADLDGLIAAIEPLLQ
jgi:aspartate aminotransferase-like enzyme